MMTQEDFEKLEAGVCIKVRSDIRAGERFGPVTSVTEHPSLQRATLFPGMEPGSVVKVVHAPADILANGYVGAGESPGKGWYAYRIEMIEGVCTEDGVLIGAEPAKDSEKCMSVEAFENLQTGEWVHLRPDLEDGGVYGGCLYSIAGSVEQPIDWKYSAKIMAPIDQRGVKLVRRSGDRWEASRGAGLHNRKYPREMFAPKAGRVPESMPSEVYDTLKPGDRVTLRGDLLPGLKYGGFQFSAMTAPVHGRGVLLTEKTERGNWYGTPYDGEGEDIVFLYTRKMMASKVPDSPMLARALNQETPNLPTSEHGPLDEALEAVLESFGDALADLLAERVEVPEGVDLGDSTYAELGVTLDTQQTSEGLTVTVKQHGESVGLVILTVKSYKL